VRLQTDGQMRTGLDVISAALLGAEEYGFSTSSLISLGCIMARRCHLNTCPVGIATQNPDLRKRFKGVPEYIVNYMSYLAQEVREHLAELGFKKLDDIIGRTDLIEIKATDHWKTKNMDLSPLLHQPKTTDGSAIYNKDKQHHKIDKILDRQLITDSLDAVKNKKAVTLTYPIRNVDRTVGAMLAGTIAKKHGKVGLPENTINITFNGSAGQSFGAFLTKGMSFTLKGDANDYLGKGLFGGRIVVTPPDESTIIPEENIIVGNTVFYGATQGEAYIRGIAGERFCVRNSGIETVVEGAGDHCCEYMTGGTVVILGKTGRNFGAGMSGGIAYVLNESKDFDFYCNHELIELYPVKSSRDKTTLKSMIEKHVDYTKSTVGQNILDNWDEMLPKFVKVIPSEYRKIMDPEDFDEEADG